MNVTQNSSKSQIICILLNYVNKTCVDRRFPTPKQHLHSVNPKQHNFNDVAKPEKTKVIKLLKY